MHVLLFHIIIIIIIFMTYFARSQVTAHFLCADIDSAAFERYTNGKKMSELR